MLGAGHVPSLRTRGQGSGNLRVRARAGERSLGRIGRFGGGELDRESALGQTATAVALLTVGGQVNLRARISSTVAACRRTSRRA